MKQDKLIKAKITVHMDIFNRILSERPGVSRNEASTAALRELATKRDAAITREYERIVLAAEAQKLADANPLLAALKNLVKALDVTGGDLSYLIDAQDTTITEAREAIRAAEAEGRS